MKRAEGARQFTHSRIHAFKISLHPTPHTPHPTPHTPHPIYK
ncbi:hypothetical protein [Chroococcidiopsis sp.]